MNEASEYKDGHFVQKHEEALHNLPWSFRRGGDHPSPVEDSLVPKNELHDLSLVDELLAAGILKEAGDAYEFTGSFKDTPVNRRSLTTAAIGALPWAVKDPWQTVNDPYDAHDIIIPKSALDPATFAVFSLAKAGFIKETEQGFEIVRSPSGNRLETLGEAELNALQTVAKEALPIRHIGNSLAETTRLFHGFLKKADLAGNQQQNTIVTEMVNKGLLVDKGATYEIADRDPHTSSLALEVDIRRTKIMEAALPAVASLPWTMPAARGAGKPVLMQESLDNQQRELAETAFNLGLLKTISVEDTGICYGCNNYCLQELVQEALGPSLGTYGKRRR